MELGNDVCDGVVDVMLKKVCGARVYNVIWRHLEYSLVKTLTPLAGDVVADNAHEEVPVDLESCAKNVIHVRIAEPSQIATTRP